ncbi:MAG: ComEA family DNA-binding protein [Fimbriimonas sp.]
MVRWTELRDRIVALIPPRDQLAYAAIIGLVLCVCGWAGGNYLRRPAPIVIRSGVTPTSQAPELPEPTKVAPSVGSGEVVVHVVGAVLRPGVVHLAAGARVEDAIREAGGAKPGADLDALNLAAKLEDGTQLNIPMKEAPGSPPPVAKVQTESAPPRGNPVYRAPKTVHPTYAAKPAPLAESKETAPGLINLNTATLEQLDSLPGIGPATAKKILDFRKQNGPFRSVDGLLDVRGIGPKKMADIRPLVKI